MPHIDYIRNVSSWLIATLLAIICVVVAPCARSQEIAEVVRSTGKIPQDHFKSWSLFLVCNPGWLTPEKSKDLYSLYGQFQDFGRTIGDDHLAVWFWIKEKSTHDPNLAENVDVERSVRICKALQLKPSSSPFILVTESYPDESNLPRDFAIFELSQMSPQNISNLLTKLTDQLVQQGRVDSEHGAHQQDQLWIRLLSATQQLIGKIGCAWSFKIQTGVLSADLHSCQDR